jgi:hypothetical protein
VLPVPPTGDPPIDSLPRRALGPSRGIPVPSTRPGKVLDDVDPQIHSQLLIRGGEGEEEHAREQVGVVHQVMGDR